MSLLKDLMREAKHNDVFGRDSDPGKRVTPNTKIKDFSEEDLSASDWKKLENSKLAQIVTLSDSGNPNGTMPNLAGLTNRQIIDIVHKHSSLYHFVRYLVEMCEKEGVL